MRTWAQSTLPASLSGLGAGALEGGEDHLQGQDGYAWDGAPLGQVDSARTGVVFTTFGKLEKSLHSFQNPNILKGLTGTQERR